MSIHFRFIKWVVASMRQNIDSSHEATLSETTRWNNLTPAKIRIHLETLKESASKGMCAYRGIDLHSILYPIWSAKLETTQHLFIYCIIARKLWSSVKNWWSLLDYPNNVLELVKWVIRLLFQFIWSKFWGGCLNHFVDYLVGDKVKTLLFFWIPTVICQCWFHNSTFLAKMW